MKKDIFLLIYNDAYTLFTPLISRHPYRLQDILELPAHGLDAIKYGVTHEPIFFESNRQDKDLRLTPIHLYTLLHENNINTALMGELEFSNPKKVLEKIDPERIFAIGISTTYTFSKNSLQKLLSIKNEVFTEVPVILGGAAITLHKEWFEDLPADFVIEGDADIALIELLKCIMNGDDYRSVNNLMWKDTNGQVVNNQRKSVDLNDVYTPRWDLVGNGKWPEYIYYESVRGCPFKCSFCSYPQQSPDINPKSAVKMFEEFQYYKSKGVEHILCFDSSMLTPISRMKVFTNLIKENDLRISWSCYGHIKQLQSKELCKAMADAGCVAIYLGIESGDDTILKYMNKHSSRKNVIVALNNLREVGIIVNAFFIFGFPGENVENARNTIALIENEKPDMIGVQTFQIRDLNIPILKEKEKFNISFDVNDTSQIKKVSHNGMDYDQAKSVLKECYLKLNNEDYNILRFDILNAGGLHIRFSSSDDTSKVFYIKDKIFPILKWYQMALLSHPNLDRYFPEYPKSLEKFEYYKNKCIKSFHEELNSNRLYINLN